MDASMIIVEDVVTEDCIRQLHVMSNSPITMTFPWDATVKETVEGGAHHLRAELPFTGMLDIWPRGWPKPRRFLVWRLYDDERVSDAILNASSMFYHATGFPPKFAFVRTLPETAKWGQDVHGNLLFEATWLPRNCVAVGGRR